MMAQDRLKALKEKTRYNPAEVEQRIFAQWLEKGYFHPSATGRSEDNFSVVIPPPNITGSLHMGHALNASFQDALVRMRRMQGINTLWLLGTDHASIATHAVVEKQLRSEGSSRKEIGREAFEARTWQWKQEYGSRIVEQFKRIGASCDYDRERFTLDEGYVRAVYKVFKELFDRGYIYKDNYMVNWDPGERTAISDLEVEHREVEDTLVEINYPLADGTGSLAVATVRPETMFADTAVAVHPEDDRYSGYVGQKVLLPLTERELDVIADEHVDPEFGTGALKITPGHDPNDFEIGRKHGLQELTCIGEDGRLTELAGEPFAGMAVSEARTAVIDALKEKGYLASEQPYLHSVGHSHRSGEAVEPLISEQWFCRMDDLAAAAVKAVESGRVRITPERWSRVYLDWMKNIRPWCISRQLWWGHRLPVWYCDNCDETYVAEYGPDSCGSCSGELRQEEDVLDTWFSSALWPFATLGWPDKSSPELKAFYPTDFLTTAREILFLWVARMIMMGLEFVGDVPFDDVYVHSVILAPDGRRMSKSLGTGIDPVETIDEHGADALRFGLLAMSSTQDVRYSAEKVRQGAELTNKLWNASRLILMNVKEVEPEPVSDQLEDRWILSRLNRIIDQTTGQIEEYDFAHAAQGLYDFFWHDICDWYLEAVKGRLYNEEGDEALARLSATLLYVLKETLALIHPIMPFVTEEIYGLLPSSARGAEHLAVRHFPVVHSELIDSEAEDHFEALIEATTSMRRFRDQVGIAVAEIPTASVDVSGGLEELYNGSLQLLEKLSRFELRADIGEQSAVVRIPIPGGRVLVTSQGIDADEIGSRLDQRGKYLEAEIRRAEGKLGNRGFVAKAPANVVQKELDTVERCKAELQEITSLRD